MSPTPTNHPSGEGPSRDPDREDFSRGSLSGHPVHGGFDVIKETFAEVRAGIEESLQRFFVAAATPNSDVNRLVMEAAKKVTEPQILLTQAILGTKPGQKKVKVDPIVFGALYPNGGTSPSNGGFALVLSPRGLELYGRPVGEELQFYNLAAQECVDLGRFARQMAQSGITVGEIERALKGTGNYDSKRETRVFARPIKIGVPGMELKTGDCMTLEDEVRFHDRQQSAETTLGNRDPRVVTRNHLAMHTTEGESIVVDPIFTWKQAGAVLFFSGSAVAGLQTVIIGAPTFAAWMFATSAAFSVTMAIRLLLQASRKAERRG